MIAHNPDKFVSAVFITFSGNCKQALHFYQSCFGGLLQFETFEKEIQGYTEIPVVSGSLVSEQLIIHGSDLVHSEGRKPGNHISIFLYCKNATERMMLITKLGFGRKNDLTGYGDQKLIELTDAFDVRWILALT